MYVLVCIRISANDRYPLGFRPCSRNGSGGSKGILRVAERDGIGIQTLVRERERKGYGWLAQRSVVVVLRVKVGANPSVLVVLIQILGVNVRFGIRVGNRVLWVKI
jgi:hypothetical protein